MDREITGVMVYYNEVCQRKLLVFLSRYTIGTGE